MPTARMLWRICHFLAPAGQLEMMHKNFMHRHLRIFVVRYSCMKFYALNLLQNRKSHDIT